MVYIISSFFPKSNFHKTTIANENRLNNFVILNCDGPNKSHAHSYHKVSLFPYLWLFLASHLFLFLFFCSVLYTIYNYIEFNVWMENNWQFNTRPNMWESWEGYKQRKNCRSGSCECVYVGVSVKFWWWWWLISYHILNVAIEYYLLGIFIVCYRSFMYSLSSLARSSSLCSHSLLNSFLVCSLFAAYYHASCRLPILCTQFNFHLLIKHLLHLLIDNRKY